MFVFKVVLESKFFRMEIENIKIKYEIILQNYEKNKLIELIFNILLNSNQKIKNYFEEQIQLNTTTSSSSSLSSSETLNSSSEALEISNLSNQSNISNSSNSNSESLIPLTSPSQTAQTTQTTTISKREKSKEKSDGQFDMSKLVTHLIFICYYFLTLFYYFICDLLFVRYRQRHIALHLQYDGGPFLGFAFSTDGETVESHLFNALTKLKLIESREVRLFTILSNFIFRICNLFLIDLWLYSLWKN